jgi:hypothetical protein
VVKKSFKIYLAVAFISLVAVVSGVVVSADEPFFVASQPADQTVDEGANASFTFNIDDSDAGQRPPNYTWLQVDAGTKLTSFATSDTLNCLPSSTFVSLPNWQQSGQGYTINEPDCRSVTASDYRNISLIVSSPFTVDGNYFETDPPISSMKISGRAVLSIDYQINADSAGSLQAYVFPADSFATAYATYLTTGSLTDLTSYDPGWQAPYAEMPRLMCTHYTLANGPCLNLDSGSAWLTIPENGNFVLVILADTNYLSSNNTFSATINNVEVNNVIATLGHEANLTISPDDSAYSDGAKFRAFATVWPGADIPIDALSRTTSLNLNNKKSGVLIPIPGTPNTGRR